MGLVVVGEDTINSHIRAKILNLLKKEKEEVVWDIQKGHSFINLTYELNKEQETKAKKQEPIISVKNMTIDRIIVKKIYQMKTLQRLD